MKQLTLILLCASLVGCESKGNKENYNSQMFYEWYNKFNAYNHQFDCIDSLLKEDNTTEATIKLKVLCNIQRNMIDANDSMLKYSLKTTKK